MVRIALAMRYSIVVECSLMVMHQRTLTKRKDKGFAKRGEILFRQELIEPACACTDVAYVRPAAVDRDVSAVSIFCR